MISLAAFVKLHNGKFLDFDGMFGAQCVDVVEYYLRDCLGDPPLPGNAINEFGEDSRHWVWVTNNPKSVAQIPTAGDVMIWGPDSAIGTSTLGHTAIVLTATTKGFVSFDQNWPRGAPCHEVKHTYAGIKGWGVPHAKAKPVVVPPVVHPVVPPVKPPIPPVIVKPPAPIPVPAPVPVPIPDPQLVAPVVVEPTALTGQGVEPVPIVSPPAFANMSWVGALDADLLAFFSAIKSELMKRGFVL